MDNIKDTEVEVVLELDNRVLTWLSKQSEIRGISIDQIVEEILRMEIEQVGGDFLIPLKGDASLP
jgi:hypothetical protein